MLTLLSFHKTLETVKNKQTFIIYATFNLQSLLSCNDYYEVGINIDKTRLLSDCLSMRLCYRFFALYIHEQRFGGLL